MTDDDPVITDPERYRILWENDLVRVLEYTDEPGAATSLHRHPNSVMVTLSAFRRRVTSGGQELEVDLPAGRAVWLPAQSHVGENIGETPTRSIFVELKGASAGAPSGGALGPDVGA